MPVIPTVNIPTPVPPVPPVSGTLQPSPQLQEEQEEEVTPSPATDPTATVSTTLMGQLAAFEPPTQFNPAETQAELGVTNDIQDLSPPAKPPRLTPEQRSRSNKDLLKAKKEQLRNAVAIQELLQENEDEMQKAILKCRQAHERDLENLLKHPVSSVLTAD